VSTITIKDYRDAGDTLRMSELRQALYDEGAILMEKVLVNLHGEEHRRRRNVEAKVLRRDYFRWYETEIFPRTLGETLAPYLAAGKADVVDFGFRAMMNLTADFAGIDRPRRTPEETARLLRILRTFGKAATLGQAVGDRAAIRAEIRAAIDEFDREFFAPSAERRRSLLADLDAGRLDEQQLPRDVLLELLRHEAELELSRDMLLKEIGFYLLAGAFTSIHTMTHALHEILEWIAAHPDEEARARSDKVFIQRCVHESTRLHPSSPTAGRRPTCPVTLPGGAAATASDYISVDLMAANRDAAIFGADAAQYNPHRMIDKGQPPYGISFGVGAHACIGLNMAVGAPQRADTDPQRHQHGTVPLIIHALLQAGARRDPRDQAEVDTSTVRNNWLRYPVLLGGGQPERSRDSV
jgi:cytochrome P450